MLKFDIIGLFCQVFYEDHFFLKFCVNQSRVWKGTFLPCYLRMISYLHKIIVDMLTCSNNEEHSPPDVTIFRHAVTKTLRLQFHAQFIYFHSKNWIFAEGMKHERMKREITHHPSYLMKGKPTRKKHTTSYSLLCLL